MIDHTGRNLYLILIPNSVTDQNDLTQKYCDFDKIDFEILKDLSSDYIWTWKSGFSNKIRQSVCMYWCALLQTERLNAFYSYSVFKSLSIIGRYQVNKNIPAQRIGIHGANRYGFQIRESRSAEYAEVCAMLLHRRCQDPDYIASNCRMTDAWRIWKDFEGSCCSLIEVKLPEFFRRNWEKSRNTLATISGFKAEILSTYVIQVYKVADTQAPSITDLV
jgi:hypothetical protein